MPYITQKQRKEIYKDYGDYDAIQVEGEVLFLNDITCAGDLQYAMAMMFKSYVKKHGLKYQTCNDIMGALAGAQMEFYRRTVAPYEDKKIEENGDI